MALVGKSLPQGWEAYIGFPPCGSSLRSQPSWGSEHLALLGDGVVTWKSDLLVSLFQQLLEIGVIKGQMGDH